MGSQLAVFPFLSKNHEKMEWYFFGFISIHVTTTCYFNLEDSSHINERNFTRHNCLQIKNKVKCSIVGRKTLKSVILLMVIINMMKKMQ